MLAVLYATTLFAGAALLFLVQPLVGKLLLPLVGGTPGVWNTCMVFFQAVLLVGYEWWQATQGQAPPFEMPARSPAATKAELLALFAHLEGELEAADFFRNTDKRAVMTRNLRNIFHRLSASRQDLQTLHGIVAALVEGRRTKQRRERKTLAPLREVEGE